MNQFSGLRQRARPYVMVAVAVGAYTVVFASYQNQFGTEIASLATIPVVVASWYFGIPGGMMIAVLSIGASGILEALAGHPVPTLLSDPGNILRSISLLLVAVVTGRLSSITRERLEVIKKLEQYERERRSHTDFLELLNRITAKALEAENLQTTLEILTEQIAILFKADDGFFAFWDETRQATTPMAAYGSMSKTFPKMTFKPGERTLVDVVLESNHPLVIENPKTSPLLQGIPCWLSSRVILGIPLVVHGQIMAAVILGYTQRRSFNPQEIAHAETVAQQTAVVLTKLQLLQNTQMQLRQLTALHEVAIITTEVETLDHLIERVTEVIGKNLFPDNFGILLMDHENAILKPHPSYRFVTREDGQIPDVPLEAGVSGHVARTGLPIRIGNIKELDNYLDIDPGTVSELCVPIKIRNHVLGVINTESSKPNAFTADDEYLLGTLAGQLATAIEQLHSKESERRWLDQLAHSNDLIYSITQIITQINRALTTDEIIQTLGYELQKIALTCIMAVYDEKKKLFTVNYTSLEPRFLSLVENGLGYPLLEYSIPRRMLEEAIHADEFLHPAAIPNPVEEIQRLFTQTERAGVLRLLGKIGVSPDLEPLRLPLVFEDNLLGILWVWGGGIRNSDLPIMSIFAKQVGISLERARLFQEVQSLALTDPLTGLHNRRSIFELGKIEFSRAHRMKRAFCCMMLDLDHFKSINDKYGHQVGDHVLQEFARRCKSSVREVDIVGRYGGEELIIVMPETDLQSALPVAERLRKRIADTPLDAGTHKVNATVSIGVAQKDNNTLQFETLIARADQALYIAKHRGRNQVAISR